MSCRRGMIKRKAYTANRKGTPVHVSASCIESTAAKPGMGKRSSRDRALLKERKEIQERMGKKFGTPKCPKGEIVRAGYTKKSYSRKGYMRKDGTRVKATKVRKAEVSPVCIHDIGTPGHGYKIPTVLEKGVLEHYGYQSVDNLTLQQRRKALSMAVKDIPPLSLFRKLVILGTLNKNKNPKMSKTFRADADWVKENYGLLRTPSKKGSKKGTKKGSRKTGRKRSSRKRSKK